MALATLPDHSPALPRASSRRPVLRVGSPGDQPGLSARVSSLASGVRAPGRPRSRAPGGVRRRLPVRRRSAASTAWWGRPRPCSPPGSPSRALGGRAATAPPPPCWPSWRGARPAGPADPGVGPAPGGPARVRGGPAGRAAVGPEAHRDHPGRLARPRGRGRPVGRGGGGAPARGQGALCRRSGPPPPAGTPWPPWSGSTGCAASPRGPTPRGPSASGTGQCRAGGEAAGPTGPGRRPPAHDRRAAPPGRQRRRAGDGPAPGAGSRWPGDGTATASPRPPSGPTPCSSWSPAPRCPG